LGHSAAASGWTDAYDQALNLSAEVLRQAGRGPDGMEAVCGLLPTAGRPRLRRIHGSSSQSRSVEVVTIEVRGYLSWNLLYSGRHLAAMAAEREGLVGLPSPMDQSQVLCPEGTGHDGQLLDLRG
jgi:hypothetical protein